MHKSIILLLGLLVFLLPFGTSNMSNSNAMAISEAEYYTDQYMGDARDMVNEYEDESSYTNNDGYGSERDRSSYEHNSYDREDASDKPRYNQEYTSYEYDNNYQSKDKDRDSSNSVSISKLNCNNVNNNINGNVSGNVNVGNSGRTGTDDGTSEEALNANAYGSIGERYNDGYQKGKDFTCITTNNNNNNNTETGQQGTTGGTLGSVRIEPGNDFDDETSGTSIATCNPDEQVIGGIYDNTGGALSVAEEIIDIPSNSYSVRFNVVQGFETDFQASAVCISKQIT